MRGYLEELRNENNLLPVSLNCIDGTTVTSFRKDITAIPQSNPSNEQAIIAIYLFVA